MAQQKGIIKLKGTIGDITFYKSQDGHLARGKGGISKERISNEASFQRTRENNSEFGRAGNAGKILRDAFRTYIQYASDSRTVSRLTKSMVEVVKADATSTRGQRNVLDGELELLEGFEFNADSQLGTSLYAPYTATIDRLTGQAVVNVPAFIPANMIAAPKGSTHFKIVSAAAEIDFENAKFSMVSAESANLPLDSKPTLVINLTNALPANSTHPLFLILGIDFYQEVNGVMYPLKNGYYNSLVLAKVSGL